MKNKKSIGRVKKGEPQLSITLFPTDCFLLSLVPVSRLYYREIQVKEKGKGEAESTLLPTPQPSL